MKIRALYKILFLACFWLVLLSVPFMLSAQSQLFRTHTTLHLQLEKTYFMAGDTAHFVLQAAQDQDAWYLIDLYASADSSQAAVMYGELRAGISAGSLFLPEQLQEGTYWLRTQVEGIDKVSFTPVYVFGRPREIEPEGQPPFQLKAVAEQGHLFAGTTNELMYDLWPRPLLADGRLIVRNRQGDILADTLLAETGKGIVEVRPEAGDELQMEVWLTEERMASSRLPAVVPVAPQWQLTEGALEVLVNVYDSISGLKLYIKGPDGFVLDEPVEAGELLSFSYAAWPSGSYTLRLSHEVEPLLEEDFSLRTNEPALHLQQHEIPSGERVQVHARVEGVQDIQHTRWQLRVYSAEQQIPLFSAEEAPEGILNVGPFITPEFSVSSTESGPASILNPERLQGTVKDSAGEPAPNAVVSLSGKGLGRMLYAISDADGNFVFDKLPLSGEERYLAAFDQQKHKALHAEVALPERPLLFPSYTLDSANLIKARSYVQKQFLLRLLQNTEAEKEEAPAASKALELAVPQDWISTFNADDYVEFPSLTEFVQEAIPGLRVRYSEGESHMQVLNIVSSRKKIYYKGDPLYLLNGYPVSSADSLLSIDMALIDKVQLVRNNASFDYGRLAQYGIVAVYTKEENVPGYFPQEGSWLPEIRLNQASWEFLSSQQETNNELPDFRQLISWSRVTKVGPDGSFSFGLNSSDELGDFMVEITIYHEDNSLMKLTHPLKIVRPSVP